MNTTQRLARSAPLATLILVSVAVVLISPHRGGALEPESAWLRPSFEHPLGCGELGVDLLAFTSSAILQVLFLATVVACLGFALGSPLGAAAAFLGGAFERAIDRLCDLVQAFPSFLLAMVVLSAAAKPSRVHLGLVLLISAWAPFTRLALAESRVLRGAAFVQAAEALGGSKFRIVFRHLLPNVLPLALVQLGSTAASLVVSEASLAFVGLGPRDGISLGLLIDQGAVAMFRAPHVLVVATCSLFLTSSALLVAFSEKGAEPR